MAISWEMFPKKKIREKSGKSVLQCVLIFVQAYVPKGIFKTHAVSLGISPKMISCLWARHLPKGCWT